MSGRRAYLGLDIGGTGVKAGVFDGRGNMLGFGHRKLAPASNPDGRVEMPIKRLYGAAKEAVREALGGPAGGGAVHAMAISSQGQTFVSVDDKGRPLHDAVIWYDSRAGKQADSLKAAYIARAERGGRGGGALPDIQAVATVCKIMWFRKHHPELMRRARRFLLLPDYFAWRLTGNCVTDSTTASSCGAVAPGADTYDADVLSLAGVGVEQLSEIGRTGEPVGALSPAAAREWGLDRETVLVVGTNDQLAGAIGAGNCRPGIMTETSGTCLAVTALLKKPPRVIPPGLLAGSFPVGGFKYIMAYTKTAGVVLDWFRARFCPGMTYDELAKAARNVPPGCRGLTALPHFEGAFSPEPDPALRGAFAGIGLHHRRADFYRALLESLAFVLRECVDLLENNGARPGEMRAIGGGARDDLWLQIKADVTGMDVQQPRVTEAAALGAAAIAAAGCGDFGSIGEASGRFWRPRKTFKPNRENRDAYEAAFGRYLALKGKAGQD